MKYTKIALAIAFFLSTAYSQAAYDTSQQEKTAASMTITETLQPEKVTHQSISADQLKKIGANNFGSIMRYQPLISAPGVNSGSRNGKSGFDRGGYTGYNIRGLDGNRVSLDIDGIPLPDATGRSYAVSTGEDTFGIGRDYIDPYLYGIVDITSGSAAQNTIKNVVGGSVSFISKSPDTYLTGDKSNYFSYTSEFDTTDGSWHNGVTSAFSNDIGKILLVYSRRDGRQTQNNSNYIDSYPMRWNSDSFLIDGIINPDDSNQITGTVDFYHKSSRENAPMWKKLNTKAPHDSIVGESRQKNTTQRYSVSLTHEFTPENNVIIDSMKNKIFYQQTHTSDNTFDQQNIVNSSFWWSTGLETENPLEKVATFSDMNTKTYGLSSDINKQYGIQSLNYGVNFSTAQFSRPFQQIGADYPTLQPQGNNKTYDVNLWFADTITSGKFSFMPGLKYSWHKITPKGFDAPYDNNALGGLTLNEINQIHGKDFTDGKLLPSLTIMYSFNHNLSTYLSYKRGVSYPTSSQIAGIWLHPKVGRASPAMVGNSDLKSETSNQFEWGLAGEITKGIALRGSVFYNSYDDFIYNRKYRLRNYTTGQALPGNESLLAKLPPSISSLTIAENRDKAYIYGAELSTIINYGRLLSAVDGFSTSFAIGYNQGKSKSSYAGDGWVDLDSVLPLKGIVSLAWDDPQKRYGASVTATFIRGKKAKDPVRQNYPNSGKTFTEYAISAEKNYMPIPGYGIVDLAAYYNITKNISINAGIYNLTDRKYWDYASNKKLTMRTDQDLRDIAFGVAPGRTYQLGITASF